MKIFKEIFNQITKIYRNSRGLRDVFNLAVLLAVTVLLFSYVAKPAFTGLYHLAVSLSDLRKLESKLTDRNAKVNQANILIDSLSPTELDTIKNALPVNPDPTKYLSILEKVASLSGVTLGSAAAKNLDLENTPSNFNSLKDYALSVDISGTYDNIKKFVTNLKSISHPTTLTKFSLNKSQDADLSANLELKVYYLR